MSAHLPTLTLAEYEQAADRIGLRRGRRARMGAMLQLVSGLTPKAAAARAGCTRQAVEAAAHKVLRHARACPLCRRPW